MSGSRTTPLDAPVTPPQRKAEADLRLDSVVKRFGDVVAVDGVSLDVEHGTFLTILGPSGPARRRSCA